MLQKKPIKIWDVNVDNIVISKLIKAKPNCKYLIRYLDKDIKPLVLIMPKMSGYVKTFKVKDKNNILTSLRIDDEKLLQKYIAIWSKIENLKNIELNTLTVYDDRYIKTKIRAYGDKVYINFSDLNLLQDEIECECFTVISIASLLVYQNQCCMQVYLDNCAYKIVKKQMADYLDEDHFAY